MLDFLLDLLILFVVIILPIGLAVYSVYQNLFKPKSPEIAGYIYDGSKLFHWLLIVLICCWLLHLLVWCLDLFDSVFIPNKLSIFSDGGVGQALKILVIEFVYTICYVAVAFRPATAEELAEAKANKTLTMDLGSAVAGMGAAIMATIVAVGGVIVAALNPINIIRVVGNTVYYTVKSAFASLASALFGLALIFGVVLCIIFAAYFYMLLYILFCAVAIIVRYFVLRKKKVGAYTEGDSRSFQEVVDKLKARFLKKNAE